MSPKPVSASPDIDKTREQLLAELKALRARNAELERSVLRAERLETDLRKNESMTRRLLEQKLYGMWVNVGGKIAFINEAGARILGASDPAAVIGKSVLGEIIHPDYRDIVRDRINAMSHGENAVTMIEEKFIRVDGIVVDVDVWAMRFLYEGEPAILVGFKDITGRKRAEEELMLTQFALDNFRDSAIWVTMDGRIVYVNQEACRSLGYSREELLSLHIWDIDPDYSPEKFPEILLERKRGRYSKFESKHVTRDGRVFPVEVTSCYTRYGDKEYLITFDRDITERKRAEEALRESEEEYRFLVENSKDVIWKIDLQGRWMFVSSNVVSVNGYRPDEMVGKTIWDFIAPECHESIKEKLLKRKRSEDVTPYITWSIHKDGHRTPLEVSTTPILDESGKVVGVQGISRDITTRMQAEAALQESEEKFRVLAETSPAAIFLYQGEKYVYVNPMAEILTGYSRDELLSGDAWHWIHPEFLGLVKERARKRQLGETLPVQYEVKYLAKDGRAGWVDFAAGLIEYRGKPAGLATAFDVSERKRAEEALKLTQASVDLAADGIIWFTPEGKVFYANQAACRALQYSREELQEMYVWGFDPVYTRETWPGHWQEIKERGSFTFETFHRAKDGRRFPVEASVNYVRSGDREFNFAYLKDITGRKRAEEELKAAKQQAELYVDLMGHDINNMNQVSLGFLELARNIIEMEGRLDEDNIVLLDKAMDSLNSSSQLIDNVRKIQREKMGLYKPEVIDVCSMVDDIIKQFRRVPGRDVRITFTPQVQCLVRANSLLKDVFLNLVGNAVKHSKGALAVDIRVDQVTENGTEYCRIAVEDDGPGIPGELKKTLFDRLNLATTRARGKGFGLCLIKMLVDDYHGRFWVEDRVEGDHTRGARFVVMLPAVMK
ncbi:MAG: sensory histidine kinase AtoS [Methanocella sp. PtaU1.Bin125]|nr:MAG: sensory histidine kinase AtoS [Methanocella sp. PtaU1.Bin125]